mmetsp:Transcript_20825/g.18449  ORF Transcript_20825/g.18449 Transcript_20825/m.18449 type:complete len:302 (-) Transcript_20825:38-943(-)|eukprot:CAMPEP_0205804728 /NCGR_PEP_ID=MMETSP0205-20121125/7732_1 /ASSEMBLY_ACC=CAM_ASM_000278 /TAXON_ID=36767 /ORGANISM="Euplotes focardii, Strain TN1" /LENGTH=301 /DNA_ID=CAMNT_0053074797 /DNA_START=4 /DNA_END=909 /DNA_ORIENTATION=-
MATFKSWEDIFKFSTDVYEEDYVYDKDFTVKAKTTSTDKRGDYSVKISQSKPDDAGLSKNSMEIKHIEKTEGGVSHEAAYKSNGHVEAETTIPLGGYNFISYHLFWDLHMNKPANESKFASALTYKQKNLEAKFKVEHCNIGILNSELTFKPEKIADVTLGAETSFDYKNTKLLSYAVGLNHQLTPTFSWGTLAERGAGEKLGNYEAYFLQEVDEKTKIAARVGHSHVENDFRATVGVKHAVSDTATFKGKINSSGLLALSWKQILGNGATLTLSSALNLTDKSFVNSEPLPFGVQLEGKF